MAKYYLIKFKSLLRVLPHICITAAVFFLSLCLVFGAVFSVSLDDASVRFRLALVCADDDPYFKAGLDIVQAYDSTRFSIDTVQMEESEARKALEKGDLDAYVVIPKGYISDAMNGELGTLKYVSTTGTADLLTLFKDEITGVVSDIIVTCEKAMYGVDDIAKEYDFTERAAMYSSEIALKYVDYILDRTDMYYVQELGIRDSLGFDGYMFSGISVLVLTMMLIPAGVCYINQDLSVHKLLKAKNIGAGRQTAGEYFALFSVLVIPLGLVSLVATLVASRLSPELGRLVNMLTFTNAVSLLTVVLILVSVGYLLFQLADELVGGMLLYFFASLALCFISGCMYPIYFFPDVIRKVAVYLPHSICRSLFSGSIIGNVQISDIVIGLSYAAGFLVCAYIIRALRLKGAKR